MRQMHRLPANNGALFQVAFQFNLLEMVNPDVTVIRVVLSSSPNEFHRDARRQDGVFGPAAAAACRHNAFQQDLVALRCVRSATSHCSMTSLWKPISIRLAHVPNLIFDYAVMAGVEVDTFARS